jgi:PadR family transcriptional regulator
MNVRQIREGKMLQRSRAPNQERVSLATYRRRESLGNVSGVPVLELQVGESSLYPALQRLLLKGWARAAWGASENNRRARYYTLTAAGRKQLAAERQEFDQMILAIQKVLNAT